MVSDETIVGTVGTCCDIWRKYMFGQAWYRFKNRCTGEGSSWDSEYDDAVYAANDRGNCSPAARVYFTLKNSVTKEQLGGVRVCIGLMCTKTVVKDETYLGQYAYGKYSLTAASTGYNNLVETLTLNETEYHLTRELVPTGAIEPGDGCKAWPSWAQGICVLVAGLITGAITTFSKTIIAPIQKFQDEAWKVTVDMYKVLERVVADAASESALWRASIESTTSALTANLSKGLTDMRSNIESTLILPLRANIAALYGDIGNIWTSMEDMVAAAQQEVTDRVTAISDLDKSLRTWIETSIISILISALDREVAKEVKK